MNRTAYRFTNGLVQYYFNADFSHLGKIVDKEQAILITDEHVLSKHRSKINSWRRIIIPPGEIHKNQPVADSIIQELIRQGADRQTVLVGLGGGVVTDLTGYVASIYMRGLKFGFVPSSLLAMVDASIGGKNGVDVGMYKNLVGTIRQPEFLLFDPALLKSLPLTEWRNGFAEIIKHGAIRDSRLFRELESKSLNTYRKDPAALSRLIRRNAGLKSAIVQQDEFEQGDRRQLNFGHTLGHAVENLYGIPHGRAIAIGMVMASRLSEQYTGFTGTARIIQVLKRYGLPTSLTFDPGKISALLRMDKKKNRDSVSFVLLTRIGKATIRHIPFTELDERIRNLAQ
jgi:3-dehydroquinate synthase